MKEEGSVYDLELEFALIWASPQGVACCHLDSTEVMGMARLQPETEAEVKGIRQREQLSSGCIYPYFLGSGPLHVLQDKRCCSQHIPASGYPYLPHHYPASHCEPGRHHFLLSSPWRRW